GDDAAGELSDTTPHLLAGEALPEFIIPSAELAQGINLSELVYRCNLSSSKSEAKKLIKSGGVRVNNIKIEEDNSIINLSFISQEGYIKISSGKKRHALFKTNE
ncbi:MAG: tyrosine--tRNA ligase, partial [Alphaproteobacteria bacterium]|nr:tyrosine--tRNA ligase [Alphaproteobacteria bacterium]